MKPIADAPSCAQMLSMLALRRWLDRCGPGIDDILIRSGHHVARAMRQANARAWSMVEVVLAGETFWERAQIDWERSLEASFFRPLRGFLDGVDDQVLRREDVGGGRELTRSLLLSLRSGTLISGSLNPVELLRNESPVDRGPDAEWDALRSWAEDSDDATGLRPLFELRCPRGTSLLVALVADLFHRVVSADPDLFEGLPEALDASGQHEDDAIRVWNLAAETHRARIDAVLRALRDHEDSPSTALSQNENAEARLQRGLSFVRTGEYDGAIAEFTAALTLDATLIAAYLHRGDAHRFRGTLDEALADYDTVLGLDGTNLHGLLHRGQVHWHLRNHSRALADFTALLALEPRNALALSVRGKVYADLGDLAAAVADFTEALRLDTTSSWTYHDRGEAFTALGNLDRAIADFHQAVRLNPHHPQSHLRLGSVYLDRGDYDRAVSSFDLGLKLDPHHAAGFLQRGRAYRCLGGFKQAIADISRAIELNASDASAYFERAQAYAAHGDQAEALEDVSESLRLCPGQADALAFRGQLWVSQGNLDLALEDFDAALDFDPLLGAAYLHRAKALIRIGRLSDAIADCDKALEANAETAVVLVVRGSAYAQQGRMENAIADFSAVLRMNPADLQARFLRGTAYSKSGKVTEAFADLSAVIRLDGDHARAYAQRASIFRSVKQHDRALDDLAQAVRIDTRFAIEYSMQSGDFHVARGEYARAVADYTLCLLFEPNNAQARAARQRAWRAFRRSPRKPQATLGPENDSLVPERNALTRVLGPKPETQIMPSYGEDEREASLPAIEDFDPIAALAAPIPPPPAVTEDITEAEPGDITVIEDESQESVSQDATGASVPSPDSPTPRPTPRLAPPTPRPTPRIAAPTMVATQAAPTDLATTALQEAEDDAARRERELLEEQERDRRAKLEEVMRRQKEAREKEAQEKARREKDKAKARKAAADDDDGERLPLWKKGMIVAAAVIALWFCGSVTMDLYADARARAPFTLDRMCLDFAADTEEARKKYDGGVFSVTGKAKFVTVGKDSLLTLESGVPEWSVRCRFDMTMKAYKKNVADKIKSGEEVTVEGRCSYQPKLGRGVILMEECILRAGS